MNLNAASNIPHWLMALKKALMHHNIYESRVIDCYAGDTSMVYYLMEHFDFIGSADFSFEIEPICVTEERWRILATTPCGVVTRPPSNLALIKTIVESALSRKEVKFFAALVQYPYNSVLMTQSPSIIIDIAGIDESFIVWINQSINGTCQHQQQPKLYSLSKQLAAERFNETFVIERQVKAYIRGMKRLTTREKDLHRVPGGKITAKNYTSQFPETRFMSRRKAESYIRSKKGLDVSGRKGYTNIQTK